MGDGRAGPPLSGCVVPTPGESSRPRAPSAPRPPSDLVRPPRVVRGDGHRALVAADPPQVLDAGGGPAVDVRALEVVVDLRVRHAERLLVGQCRAVVLEVGGRNLRPRGLRGPELAEQRRALALRETGQGGHVRAAVAELRVEAGHGLGGVVGADDEQPPLARERVLGDHPLPGLDVALVEVGQAVHTERGRDVRRRGVGGGADVHAHGAVRGDEPEGGLRVVLVGLLPVGQAHGDELHVARVRVPGVGGAAQLLDGELAEAPGQRRVLAPGDAEDEPARVGGEEVVGEEGHPALDLGGGVDVGFDAQLVDDRLAEGAGRCAGSRAAGGGGGAGGTGGVPVVGGVGGVRGGRRRRHAADPTGRGGADRRGRCGHVLVRPVVAGYDDRLCHGQFGPDVAPRCPRSVPDVAARLPGKSCEATPVHLKEERSAR